MSEYWTLTFAKIKHRGKEVHRLRNTFLGRRSASIDPRLPPNCPLPRSCP